MAVGDFFAATVQREVGPFLDASGFSLDASFYYRVNYSRGDSTISFDYLPELPPPSVGVVVGRREPNGRHRRVALWRSIPESDQAFAYTSWRFTDRPGLEGVLARVVKEVLPNHARRLWEDDLLFDRLVSEQEAETQANYYRMLDDALLRAARGAFELGDFRTALEKYALLGADGLKAEDRRRIYQARVALGKNGPGTGA